MLLYQLDNHLKHQTKSVLLLFQNVMGTFVTRRVAVWQQKYLIGTTRKVQKSEENTDAAYLLQMSDQQI